MKVKPARHEGEVTLEVNQRDQSMLEAAASEPFRIKRILVPVDFSDCSRKAMKYAIPLAKQHGATLTLVYVLPAPPYSSGEYGVIDLAAVEADLRRGGETQLGAFLIDEVRGTIDADTVVREGKPGTEIVDLARELPADLIVISTHGRTGLKHVLLGSVAENVVRHAPCPVLVVREDEHEFVKT